ncbi:MAG: hypothetical protein JRL30_25635, partial [Deltaproteobacteria bacterium]|nr:hypothetical protein [Deltaproteobacteria bacterium]
MNTPRSVVSTFFFISLLTFVLGTPHYGTAAPGAVVNVFEKSEVNGDEIRLGDISRVTGNDLKLVEKLRGIAVGRTPLPGKSRRIDEAQIRLRMKQFDIEPSHVRLNVPDNSQVARGFTRVSKEKIREVVLAYIRQALSLKDNKVRVRDI